MYHITPGFTPSESDTHHPNSSPSWQSKPTQNWSWTISLPRILPCAFHLVCSIVIYLSNSLSLPLSFYFPIFPLLPPFLFLLLFLSSAHQCFLPQSPLMFKDQMQQDVIMVLKFPSNSPVTHVAANTLPHLSIPAAVTVTCSRLFAVNRWHNTVGESHHNTSSKVFAIVFTQD